MVILLLVLLLAGACARPVPPPRPDRAILLVGAVRADSVVAVRQLLDAGVSPDTMAADGTRPLTEAARHGRLTAARALLDDDARLDLADSSGMRPIDYAIATGHRELAALLIRAAVQAAGAGPEAMAWIDAVGPTRGRPGPWHRVLDGELLSLGLAYAVLEERNDVAAALRRAAEVPNRTGYAPLALAARFGNLNAVDVLLRASANPNAESSGPRHETPLMEAARDGYVDVGRRLIRGGAHVNAVDGQRQTALMWAVREGETGFAAMLLAAGADPARRDLHDDTALDLARRINHTDLIALLEAHAPRR